MNRPGERNLVRVLVLGAAIAALGLAGCGRKGGLDPPPSASVAGDPQPQQQTGISPIGSGGTNDPVDQRAVTGERAGIATDGGAIAPRGEKRRIPLDVLID